MGKLLLLLLLFTITTTIIIIFPFLLKNVHCHTVSFVNTLKVEQLSFINISVAMPPYFFNITKMRPSVSAWTLNLEDMQFNCIIITSGSSLCLMFWSRPLPKKALPLLLSFSCSEECVSSLQACLHFSQHHIWY